MLYHCDEQRSQYPVSQIVKSMNNDCDSIQ